MDSRSCFGTMGKRAAQRVADKESRSKVQQQGTRPSGRWFVFGGGAAAVLAAFALHHNFPSRTRFPHEAVDVQMRWGESHKLEAELVLDRQLQNDTIRVFAFTTARSIEIKTQRSLWKSEEATGWIPDKFGPPLVVRLTSLLDAALAAQLLTSAKALGFERGPDSVDRQPTFEAPLFRNGVLANGTEKILSLLQRPIEERLLPYARERFQCPTCIACTSIIRRYLPGERRQHPWHYDSDAFVTVVVPLTPANGYTGGLYLLPSFDRGKREFVVLGAGDAVLHNYDALHGVDVLEGERTSLVVWLKTGMEACLAQTSPWYDKAAALGEPRAQYNLGRILHVGLSSGSQDKAEGARWYRLAADQGHTMAMYNLAVCLHHGRGVPQNETEAVTWYAKAANDGHPMAMANYGYMLLFGRGVPQQNSTEAAKWFLAASKQGNEVAMFQLGHLLAKGKGVPENRNEAMQWFAQAKSLGHKGAESALAILQRGGSLKS